MTIQRRPAGWPAGEHPLSTAHAAFTAFTETTIHQARSIPMATKAQETYERVEALINAGSTRPEAFKTLADERQQSVDSIRGAYYTGRRQAGVTSSSPSRRRTRSETTPDDAIAAAIASLEKSIEAIETEVLDAEERAEEAQREHQALRQAAGPKVDAIKAKVEALRGDATDD